MTATRPRETASEVEVEIHEHLEIAIVTLRGDHDLATTPLIKEALSRAGDHPRVLVDLSECTFADTAVIGALILAHGDLTRRQGSLEVVIPPDAPVRRAADLTCLATYVRVHPARHGLALSSGGEAA